MMTAPDNLQWNQSVALEDLTQFERWIDPVTGDPVTPTVTPIVMGDLYPIQPVNGRAYKVVDVSVGTLEVAFFEVQGL